ncbi:MAG: alpha/beta hydrolase [Planctomycetales bacterium]|nr:alpha/beta hydrolase [Planctomycetales bacterium]
MTLHPQSAILIRAMKEQNAPGWHEMPPVQGRLGFSGLTDLFGPKIDVFEVKNLDFDGLGARFYRPSEEDQLPVVVYFHGGGWVLGDVETHDALCRRIANASNCCVVSVDYRVAPEAQYPLPLDDCEFAVRQVASRSAELNADGSCISLAGDSAGGNLAAATALRLRDAGDLFVQSMVLIYPVIERDFDTPSYLQFATDHGLSRDAMRWYWQQYVGEELPQPNYAELASANLQDLPRTMVLTAEYDVLRDEGETFAENLRAAGVSVVHKRFAGMLHGFVHFGGFFDTSAEAIADIASFLASR